MRQILQTRNKYIRLVSNALQTKHNTPKTWKEEWEIFYHSLIIQYSEWMNEWMWSESIDFVLFSVVVHLTPLFRCLHFWIIIFCRFVFLSIFVLWVLRFFFYSISLHCNLFWIGSGFACMINENDRNCKDIWDSIYVDNGLWPLLVCTTVHLNNYNCTSNQRWYTIVFGHSISLFPRNKEKERERAKCIDSKRERDGERKRNSHLYRHVYHIHVTRFEAAAQAAKRKQKYARYARALVCVSVWNEQFHSDRVTIADYSIALEIILCYLNMFLCFLCYCNHLLLRILYSFIH